MPRNRLAAPRTVVAYCAWARPAFVNTDLVCHSDYRDIYKVVEGFFDDGSAHTPPIQREIIEQIQGLLRQIGEPPANIAR